jgi:tetratricopeptide (TPR) repeat protein
MGGQKERSLGWFGKKKQETQPEDKGAAPAANGSAGGEAKSSASGTGAPEGGGYSPDKAEKFFDRAQGLHDATNYGYSMQLWLGGLRQDPTSMKGLEGFVRSALAYSAENKKGPAKDIVKMFSGGKSDLDRYLYDLLMWGCKFTDAGLGIRAMTSASKLGLAEPAVWIADRAAGAASQEKRPRVEYLVAALDVFEKFARYDKAVVVGEAAVRIAPQDGKLATRVKNLSAESTMSRGGFDKTGEAGGFRQNIRNTQKQQDLEDEDKVGKTEETLDRLIEKSLREYEANPTDRPTINKYGKFLLERGKPEDEEAAHRLFTAAFEVTKEFRYKEQAERIRIVQARRRVMKLKAAAEAAGSDESAREEFRRARQELREREMASLEDQVAAYPTDLIKKYELGKAYYSLQRYDQAVGMFQEAKADPKHRSKVLNLLGLSFLHMDGFTDEAIETLRQALDSHDTHTDDVGMELRYGLMQALGTRARENNDLADAEEAYKLAAGITIQKIDYKDVRKHRDDLKALIAQIKSGGGGG